MSGEEGRIYRSRLVEEDASTSEAYTSRVLDARRAENGKDKKRHASCLRVACTTFNVGNSRVNDVEMGQWLSRSEGCDVVAIALQEANYLSKSQKRGIAAVAGFAVVGAMGPLGLAAGLTLGAATAGGMALHSHVMPKMRSSSLPICRNVDEVEASGGEENAEDRFFEEDDEECTSSSDEGEEDHSRSSTLSQKKGSEGTPMLSSAIAAAVDRQMLPRGFERAVFNVHGQMRLIVYVRKHVSVTETKQNKHGMGMAMNKGGLAARLVVSKANHNFDLAFVGAHLPAHEGKRKARSDALAEILHAFAKETHDADATFFMGDLNYRLSRDDVNLEFGHVADLVKADNLAPLHDADELVGELGRLVSLRAYATPSCDFKPTFKVKRKVLEPEYNPKRCPAWCDRVLFKTKPRLALSLEHYDSFPEVTTSDHKPIVFLATLQHQGHPHHHQHQNADSDSVDILTGEVFTAEDSPLV